MRTYITIYLQTYEHKKEGGALYVSLKSLPTNLVALSGYFSNPEKHIYITPSFLCSIIYDFNFLFTLNINTHIIIKKPVI